MLNYDSLSQYSDYMVQVKNSKSGEFIEGLLDNENFSYANAAEIGGSFLGSTLEGAAKGALKAGAGKVAGEFGKSVVDSNFKTIASTFTSYEGASQTSFQISMHIFPKSNSYKDIMYIIDKLTQPDTEKSVMINSYLYSTEDMKKLLSAEDPFKGNLIHVSIGSWFLATGLFCTTSNMSFSKYVDKNGKPLFLQWDASFQPYKLLNADELSSWHRK